MSEHDMELYCTRVLLRLAEAELAITREYVGKLHRAMAVALVGVCIMYLFTW